MRSLHRPSAWAGAIVALTLSATACGSTTPASGGSATDATGQYAKGKTIILDTIYRAPLAQNQAAGAKQAAAEAGATVKWVGPTDINPPAGIKALQDAAAAGADGAIVAAFPGDLFKVPIDQTGLPTVTIDLYSPGSKASTHFAPDKYALGEGLAKEFAKALPASAKGMIIGGICVPGLPSLVAPQQGFIDTMKKLQPGVTVKGDQPVDGDATKNYASWQRIIQQNPDALGFVGQCDQDVPNLIKLKKDSRGSFLIGATSGDSAANIGAVADGTVTAIISQDGWVEGYLAARMLLMNIALKTPLPKGWIDSGFTVITKDNASAVAARVTDPSKNAAEFKTLLDKVLADPQAASAAYEGCRGCGTSFKS